MKQLISASYVLLAKFRFPFFILILISFIFIFKNVYQNVSEYRKIERIYQLVGDFVNENQVFVKEENENSTCSEFDSSQFFQFYTKNQLTELKKICFWRARTDGKQGYEHHAINQSVEKWKGVPFDEFMETIRKENFCADKDGKTYFITEKWTIPAVKQDGIFKPATIFRTTNKYSKIRENYLKNQK